jgi:hypothetical protein
MKTSRTKVWVATANSDGASLALRDIRPVQDLPGSGAPFDRLVDRLRLGDYIAAAVDAPFSIPKAHIPVGGWEQLVQMIDGKPPAPDRPFPAGETLLDIARSVSPILKAKPLRDTEDRWRKRKVNTRSTLWNGGPRRGGRPGAPFACGCLKLIARTGRPCWPWRPADGGALVEAFPAAQLRQWGLPYQGYDGETGAATRRKIIDGLHDRIRLDADLASRLHESADALDAVLCIFGAIAAHGGDQADVPIEGPEGWISVHA